MSLLWNKGSDPHSKVREFTTDCDKELDLELAQFDIEGSIAHVKMLTSISLLSESECEDILRELEVMLRQAVDGTFIIEEGVEDIHSQVELNLTKLLGDPGKKIHSGRSRNDQVLLDIKLFLKNRLEKIFVSTESLFHMLIDLSERYKSVMLPGYTHSQLAMPSSFGLWFGAYAETLTDDLTLLIAAHRICDQNPLGSAAGYGNSFPLDREMTTQLLGFSDLHYNSVAAQMSRGKSEKAVAFAISAIAATLNKLASDSILFMSANYGFISFPDELTTGSSIMPHKKNPDVWELIRAKSNLLQDLPNQIALMTTNLMHGYHRDFQLIKNSLHPSISNLLQIIEMTELMLSRVVVNREIMEDERYETLFCVEEVNRRVLSGTPFREAYREVADELAGGKYVANKKIAHTHMGSIGNLCNGEIVEKFNRQKRSCNFQKAGRQQ